MDDPGDDAVADRHGLPTLTHAQKLELAALRALLGPDTETGPATEPPPRQAALATLYRPVKTATTLRIDADVLAWLKAPGKGYQTRINAILRREMLAALES
jgi:uncharacterized protein (DUF4415 family)